jgi:isoquinoline 1-oxidoreductase subunit beta
MRRAMLFGALGAGAYLCVRYALLPRLQRLVGRLALPGPFPPVPRLPRPSTDPWDWFAIDPDNTIHLYAPKIEVGQGNHTLLAQLAAEELGIEHDQLVVHQPDTGRGLSVMLNITGGSASVALTGHELRIAAATLRASLQEAAARRWGCRSDEVSIDNRHCIKRDAPTQRLSFAELASDRRMLTMIPAPALTEPSRWRVAGQALPRIDLPAKVTGAAVFGADVRLPGMLYGAVARAPREGATLSTVSGLEHARSQPGVVAVVHEAGMVAVVAERRRQAVAALAMLELEWNGGTALSQEALVARIRSREGAGALIFQEGQRPVPHENDRTITAEYRSHMCAPLPFESPVTTADVRPEGATIYAPVQSTHFVRNRVASALKLRPERVRVIVTTVGGSFARKHGAVGDPSVEAALLARAVGRPVQVAYTMAEDLRYGIKRAPSHGLLRATVRANGSVAAFSHSLASGDGSKVFPPQDLIPQITGVDLSGTIGSQPLYSVIPYRRVNYTHIPLPVLTSMFRAPGLTANVFFVESFIDELATLASIDPLAYRLAHLGDDELNQRLRAVLEAIARQADWRSDVRRAHGLACYAYGKAVAAMVAEVAYEENRVRIVRLRVAVESGRQVNPDVASSQIEGAALMGLSWAVSEQVSIAHGLVRSVPFRDYRPLRPSAAPPVDVVLLEGDGFQHGLNEIAAGLVAPAVANAAFRLTGRRLRALPLALDEGEACG